MNILTKNCLFFSEGKKWIKKNNETKKNMSSSRTEKLRKLKKLAVYLTEDDLILLVIKALVKARKTESQLNPSEKPKIHIAISGKGKNYAAIVHSDDQTDLIGKKKAQDRALTSLKHSTNQTSVPSRRITEPGAVPLYKKVNGQKYLIGSIGVSGDAPDIDEAIAIAAAENFYPAEITVVEEETIKPESRLNDLASSYLRTSNQRTGSLDASLISTGLQTEAPIIPLSMESPRLMSNVPLEVSSEIVAELPALPTISPILSQSSFKEYSVGTSSSPSVLSPLSSSPSVLPPLSRGSSLSALPPLSNSPSALPPLSNSPSALSPLSRATSSSPSNLPTLSRLTPLK